MINFNDLYEQYATDVYRFSFWLCGNTHDAEDITAETFVRIWAGNSRIRTETVKAYLFTIARNLYLQQVRKRKKQVSLPDNQLDFQPTPDVVAENRDELSRVIRTLQGLSEIDRAAFILRVEHELPYAEIARTLNISLSATKVKVYRVRLKLKENLNHEYN